MRRKFHDLEQAHASPLAREALERIAVLYAIEHEVRGRPPDERRQVRQTRARPLLESLHDWLEQMPALAGHVQTAANVTGDRLTPERKLLLEVDPEQGVRELTHSLRSWILQCGDADLQIHVADLHGDSVEIKPGHQKEEQVVNEMYSTLDLSTNQL